jgi:hypothetical protein
VRDEARNVLVIFDHKYNWTGRVSSANVPGAFVEFDWMLHYSLQGTPRAK